MTPIQKQIIVLRKRGVTNRMISEKLVISLAYNNAICMRFIREGLIEPREARKPRDPAVAKRNEKIVSLFLQGVPSGKIATKLGVNRDIVYSHIAAMRTAGKIPRPKVGRG